MTVMIIGLLLWVVLHLFKRFSPRVRYDLSVIFGQDIPKGTLAILIILGLVMIIFGYLHASFQPIYEPPSWGGIAAAALMFLALLLAGSSMSKTLFYSKTRHPLLMATSLWSLAHLLSNGDLASALLFGTLGFWALLQMSLISLQDDVWIKPAKSTPKQDLFLLLGVCLVYAAIFGLHYNLGHSPF